MRRKTGFLCGLLAISGSLGFAQQLPGPEENDINEKRHDWFWNQRTYPNNPVPDWVRLDSFRQASALTPTAPPGRVGIQSLSSTVWTSIGPQPIGTQPYADSGRIWALAVDPRNSAVVYAGTDGGGVWKTTDSGTTWNPLTDFQPGMGITSLVLDPSNPDIVYAGSGSNYPGGLLKSTDAGATWTQITAPFVPSGGYAMSIDALAVHPTNGQIVLASAGGIYRSTDGGATWALVNSGSGPADLIFDPTNGNIAYASVYSKGILKSTDAGKTWSSANGSGSNSLPSASASSTFRLALAPSSPATLYASVLRASDYYLLGFYKTTDGGANWSSIGVPTGDDAGYWDWQLSVHPTKPNVVFAGRVGLHLSLDGGVTWPRADTNVHVDHHAQAYSPDGSIVYIGNDGGIWSTTSTASANPAWKNLNSTLSTVLFYPGISIQQSDPSVTYGGTQDNGTLKYSSAAWKEVACGDGAWTAIDFTQPQVVYTNCQDIAIYKTTNGTSFSQVQNGINTSDRVAFIPPLVMDPSNAQTLYFGTYRVYQTTNGAGSWTAISPDLTGGSVISTVAVAPSDSNTVYTGSADSKVYVTRNAKSGSLSSWSNVTPNVNRAVTQVTIHPADSQTAYVTYSGYSYYDGKGHIYKTTNAGGSWTNVTGNLPDVPVNDLAIDPDFAGVLYIGTDIGVFRSLDGGASWLPLGAGLPRTVVNSLKLHQPSRTLRAATYGRGAWDLLATLNGQVLVTIGSSSTGAPFTLEDGTTYLAPVTLAWTPGQQHTVTWVGATSAQPGARYVFQGWADGPSANQRVITTPASNTTYTANVKAQYQILVTVTPAGSGTLTASPSSADGFYDAGTSVQVTAAPATGYSFWYFAGDLTGNTTPQTLTMNAPHSLTLNFYCSATFTQYLSGTFGPGPTTGLLQWQVGVGCNWAISSNQSWLSLSGPASGTGSAAVNYTIAQNTGASRSATVAMTGDNFVSNTFTVTQEVSTSSRPSIVSLSPASGQGTSQVFTLQVYDGNGYQAVNWVDLIFGDYPLTNQCRLAYLKNTATTGYLYLYGDSGFLNPITVPGSGTLANSRCQVNGSQFQVSGSGQTASFSFGITFLPGFTGVKSITADARDQGTNAYSPTSLVGQWNISPLATISSPAPGTTLTGTAVTFSWAPGLGASGYWLDVGTARSVGNIFGGPVGTATSKLVTGLPHDGSTVYVSLYTNLNGSYQDASGAYLVNSYTYTAFKVAALTAPAQGSTLGSSATFTWNAVPGAAEYWLDVGTSPGVGNIFGGSVGANTSKLVTGLPLNGSTVHVSLYTKVNGSYQDSSGAYLGNSYSYPTTKTATITSPAPGSTLAGATVTFTWAAVAGATEYWLDVGRSPGVGDISGGSVGSNTSKVVTGLPLNGGAIYASLYTRINGSYQDSSGAYLVNSYTYTAARLAAIISPAAGSTLTAPTVTFSWAGVPGATEYWLDVGTAPFVGNIASGSVGANTSRQVTGLPVDGSAVYATLYTKINGSYQDSSGAYLRNSYTYTAMKIATITSPPPGSTLSGQTATFAWTSVPGATEYWLDVGTAPFVGNISGGSVGSSTSKQVSGLPVDGSTVYVTLYTKINGSYQGGNGVYLRNAYTYQTSKVAVITSPAAGSTLGGSAVMFTWTSAPGVTEYWLDVGTAPFVGNIASGSVGASTSKLVTGLPVDGSTIYASLYSRVNGSYTDNNGVYNRNSYTYLAPRIGAITNPAPGSILAGSTVTFTWSAYSGGTTQYWLDVGTAPFVGNIFGGNVGSATSQQVTGLPVNGAAIYVTLYTKINGSFQDGSGAYIRNSYVFTAAPH